MKEIIRLNTFETNSSSMHVITVCAFIEDKDYIIRELTRYKQEDGSYRIVIELDEDKLDNGSFTFRRYIPHTSLNDKLMYLYATICQHFNRNIHKGPETVSPIYYSEKQYQEKLIEYKKDFNSWLELGYLNHNREVAKQFMEYLDNLSSHLSWKLKYILFGDNVTKIDTRPEIKIIFKYILGEDYSILPTSDDYWFSTGCTYNEEFFDTCCKDYMYVSEWLFNPYNQILAGSDEMNDDLRLAQLLEAKRLLDDSWKKYKESNMSNDLFKQINLNPGKLIWPSNE